MHLALQYTIPTVTVAALHIGHTQTLDYGWGTCSPHECLKWPALTFSLSKNTVTISHQTQNVTLSSLWDWFW